MDGSVGKILCGCWLKGVRVAWGEKTGFSKWGFSFHVTAWLRHWMSPLSMYVGTVWVIIWHIMSHITNVFLIHHKTNWLKSYKDEHIPFKDIQLLSKSRILYTFLFYLLSVNIVWILPSEFVPVSTLCLKWSINKAIEACRNVIKATHSLAHSTWRSYPLGTWYICVKRYICFFCFCCLTWFFFVYSG